MFPLLLAFSFASTSAIASGADEHLLAGARLFREGRFGEALVEFRVAEKLGHNGEAAFYAAAALVRLKRPEDAVEAFADAEQRSPKVRDELFDYYRGVACNDARLYLCADKFFARVSDRAGSHVAAEAQRMRKALASLLRPEPGTKSIDWYLQRANEASRKGRSQLERSYLEEAAGLSARRADKYRGDEASRALARGARPPDAEPVRR
jgi:tetratricopeptide (TPR) repeat protein